MNYLLNTSNEILISLPRFTFIMILLIIFSILIRVILQWAGQKWITTTAHTSTLVVLPIITYIITKVISGNIALSLGMVGALSIVRFRNPVRSPLELSVYFCAITMGIAAGVSLKWLGLLGFALSLSLIILTLINIFYLKIFKKNFFTSSFAEGNSLSTLEIKTNKEIELLDNSNLLNLKKKSENQFHYVLTSNDFNNLREIESKLSKSDSIIDYQINK